MWLVIAYKSGATSLSTVFYLHILAVAQWIVHMPPKRGIQVRFLSAGPLKQQNLSTGHVDKSEKVFVSRRFL